MKPVFREYNENDYAACERLTNEAWDFDGIFRPQALAELAKRVYTKGSVVSMNYGCVVEVKGQIVGFIFGLNELATKPRKNYLFALGMVWRLYRVKFECRNARKQFMNALASHSRNRSQVMEPGKSEILLFVVSKQFQGLGYGKRLWAGFRKFCVEGGVKTIFVETNRLGASSFYEQLGFSPKADFDSALHEYATEKGQACIYQHLLTDPA